MAEQESRARLDPADHSPRQRSQEPLAELKQLYDTAPVGLGFVDTDTRYIRLNEQLAAINGRPVDEHIGRTLREIIPEIAPEVERLHRRVIETGEPVLNVEIHGSTRAAPERDFLASYYPVRADDGSVQGVSVVVQDITERKRAEAALRQQDEEERRFSELLAALHDVTNELSTADSFDELCRAAVELGRSRLGFDRLGIWFVGVDRASATGTFGVDEHGRLRDERGSRVSIAPASVAGQVLASKRPFVLRQDAPTLDDQAEVVGRGSHAIAGLWNGAEMIGFISTDNLLLHQPITERQCKLLTLYASAVGHLCALKRLQEELRRRAEELAEADRRKDEFLALLAHELRNPLAPILNAVELIKARVSRISYCVSDKDRKSPDTQHEIRDTVPVIDRQVRQMARLVDDLLDVSRITQGRVELRKERIELTAVVRSAVQTSLPLIEAREHELSVSLPPEAIWLDADPARLEQILANLLNNAAKYTEPGGRIWLTAAIEPGGPAGSDPTAHIPHPTPCVVVRVRDTGVGLALELLPLVFDLFTQADRSLDRSQGGLGIGLTLVRRLAELHGGSVHADSAGPGQGSEFVVRLPVSVDGRSLMVDGPEGRASAPPSAIHHQPSAKRVLVVDDNVDAAATLADLLDLWGHEVRVAHDGRLALDEMSCFQPDVVLLDIGLPQMDGYEVARRLREQTSCAGLRLVAVTGYGQEEDRRKAHSAGFDDHLVKPVDPHVLEQLIAAVPRRS
jgi:PAS domain S-box-containing protein